jgi:outer membrane lipoprotein
MKKGKILFILGFAAFMVSCAPFSREMMRQVDETLIYQAVQKEPQKYIGKTVLWGGVIIETTNKQGETILKIRQTELDMEKRPKNLDSSAGRFIVRYDGFLDPVIYKEGREITVGGEMVGQETLPLGNIMYSYPVVLAKEVRLWEKREPLRYPYPYWDYPPYWGPYGSPYWYPYWRYHPYHRW